MSSQAAESGNARPSAVTEGTLRVQGQYPIEPNLLLWLPGSMDWPHLRGIPYDSPPSKACTFQTVELSNAWLTARFVPQVGFRLYDLTWNDDSLKRQAFRIMEDIETDHMYRWEGSGYLVTFGAMKWGFPFTGHTISDHALWQVTHGVDDRGSAWAEGTYTDIKTGIVGTVRAELPADAAILRFTFSCRNSRDTRQGIDYWVDSYTPTDKHLEYALPATEVITHQRGWKLFRQMFCSWPIQAGRDRRFLKNWDGSQGIFPTDLSAGYSAFYDHSRGNGVVRIFPCDIAKGVKFWTPGVGDWLGEMFGGLDVTQDERQYLAPSQTLSWQETWYPVRDLRGIDAAGTDVALRVAADKDTARLYLTSTRSLPQARVLVTSLPGGQTSRPAATRPSAEYRYETRVDLAPGTSVGIDLPAFDKQAVDRVQVTITAGDTRLDWTQDAALLKPEYADEDLAKDREAYVQSLKKARPRGQDQGEDPAAPADGFLFRHAGQIGGTSGALLRVPNACCRLGDGSIALADESRIKIFRPDLTLERVLKIDGLRWPMGLAAQNDTLYIADSGHSRIVCANLQTGKIVRTIDLPSHPGGIAIWREGLAITLPRRSEVIGLDLSRKDPQPQQLAGPGDVLHPFGIIADGDRLLVADPGNQRILAISRDGQRSEVACARQGLSTPSRVVVAADRIYVLDAGRSQILKLDPAGGQAQVHLNGRLFGPVSLGLPSDLVALDKDLLVSVASPASLNRLAADGRVIASFNKSDSFWPNAMPGFESFCRLPDGSWLLGDTLFGVFWFDRDGKLLNRYGAWGRNDGQFWEPNALACDSRGYVYVSDFFNFRVLRFNPAHEQMTNLGMNEIVTDGVPEPSRWYVRGLAIDAKDRLAAAVCGGQGIYLYSPAPENRLLAVLKPYERFHPMGLAYDANGDLYVVDDAASKVLVYREEQLARRLEAADNRPVAPDPTPTVWRFASDSCALAIAPDGKGGCYIVSASNGDFSSEKPGQILHLDASGKAQPTLAVASAPAPRQFELDGKRLLVSNIAVHTNPGLVDIPLDGPATTAPATRILIPYPQSPTEPGTCRSVAGIMRTTGDPSEFLVLDTDRKVKLVFDPQSLTLKREEPCDLHAHFYNPSPDGTVVLHEWRGKRYLWNSQKGQITTWSLADIKNPSVAIHDPSGGWWVTIYEPQRRQVAFYQQGQDKPAWSIPCSDSGDGIGELRCFAPRSDGTAWAADYARHQLLLLSRKDGRVLKTSLPGVVRSPLWIWPLDDGSMLVSDRAWGILHVSADATRSWRAVRDLPPGGIWEITYDAESGRLFYPMEQANSAAVGWATPLALPQASKHD